MSCPGLHCAGCASGSAAPVAGLAALEGGAWLAANLAAVIAIAVTCGVITLAVVVLLARGTRRREAAYAASPQHRRAIGAAVIPQVTRGTPLPAIEYHRPSSLPRGRPARRVITGRVLP